MARKLLYEVTIAGADNGYIVRVGCKVLVFKNSEELIEEFAAYVRGEKTALSKELNPEVAEIPTCAEQPMPEGLADSVARNR